MRDIYDAWFEHIQSIHATNPDRHTNQVQYDKSLKENYPWVFFNVRQAETAPVCHDIGCAYGTLALGLYALGYIVYASDVTDEYVNRPVLSTRGINYTRHDIESGPLEDVPPADLVLFTEVLEHLNTNPANALLNIRERTKTGGLMIMSTPRLESGVHQMGLHQTHAGHGHWTQIPFEHQGDWIDAHMYVYSEPELFELLEVTGWNVTNSGLVWNGITTGLVARKTAESQEAVRDRTLAYCGVSRVR